MFILWLLLGVPLIFVGGALAVDFAISSLARDEVASLASASATAGAWQIIPNTANIDCGGGVNSAQVRASQFATSNKDILRAAKLVGAPQVRCIPSGTPTGLTSADTVEVTLTYTTTQTPFTRFFSATSPTWKITRSAVVCLPGSAPTIANTCTRPAGY